MIEMWQLWLIVAGIFFIMEILTVGFLVFWIAIGALAAMVVSLFTSNIIIQTAVFVIASSLLMFFSRPLVKKILKEKDTPTNSNRIIGEKGLVTSEINPTLGIGQIKILGETWSAKTEDNSILSVDTEVTVIKIDGVKAVVKM